MTRRRLHEREGVQARLKFRPDIGARTGGAPVDRST